MKSPTFPKAKDPCGLWHPHGNLEALASFKLPKNARVLEVGAYVGESALALSVHGTVFSVDTWIGNEHDCLKDIIKKNGYTQRSLFKSFCKNVGPLLFKSVIPLVGTSRAWADVWPDHDLDLVFIDAEHTYDAVRQDISLWIPKVKKGGIICGDDYYPDGNFPGVKSAVDEAFRDLDGVVDTNVWCKRIV